MSISDYAYAYLTSSGHIRAIVRRQTGKWALALAVLAVLMASFPEQFSLYSYAYNVALVGGAVALINGVLALAISRVSGMDAWKTFNGLTHFTGAVLITNMGMLAVLYALGLPFGVSDLLLSVAATLISTYYFIVLLAVASGALIEKESKRVWRYAVELCALALWYIFVFYILRMTA